jgi:hypothetical protein
MLSDTIDNKRDTLKFHASHLQMMNDMNEGKYILDQYFTSSDLKKKIKNKWQSFYSSHTPFVISLIRTNKYVINKGSIPMWKMYGDNGSGAFFKFNYDSLVNYCKDHSIKLKSCDYDFTNDRDEKIKELNSNDSSSIFWDLLEISSFTKTIDWEYEREWRIVKYLSSEDALVKQSRYGVVMYTEIEIPILTLKEICLGPMTNANDCESIKCLCDKVNRLFPGTEIKVTQSKLKVRL